MREIKFRAWDTFNKIMCVVYHLEWIQGDLWADVIPHLNNTRRTLMVKHNPIMQYTGLKDKHGKEIYEGDVLQSTCEMVNLMSGKETGNFKTETYEVRWEEDKGRWGRWRNDKFELLSGLNKAYMLKWYEIIGNIWENGDLLNDEETKQPVKEGGCER